MKNNTRIVALVASSVVTCLVAFYMNDVLDMDSVYTSMFYIPVIMTGLWYFRFVIPLALVYALYYNILDFVSSGKLSVDQIFRGLILILGAVVLNFLGKKISKKNQELEIRRNLLLIEKERLRITLQSIGDGVISTDNNGNITLLNGVAKNLTGWKDDSALGRPFSAVFNIINEYTREKCEDPIKKVLDTGNVIGLANHTVLISKDGTERPIADSAAPILDENGKINGVILVFRDVTDEKKKQDEIEFLSYHDQLTGLANRRYLEAQLKRLDTEAHLPISVIMGDVNGLKLTNDAFGHVMGDNLLQKAAEALKSICRHDDIICRYGGDEFVIILPKTGLREAETISKRIKKLFSDIKIGPANFSISIGWATKSSENDDIMETINTSETFMYKNKLHESPSTRGNIIHSIMNTLKGNSESEKCHSERVSEMCVKIAHAYNLDDEEIGKYRTACIFHDIGKISVDPRILNKMERLNPDEWEAIKRHPEIGYRILNAVPEFAEIAGYVWAHHERWDGKGYPRGLKGAEIPYISRIIAVSDSYDAMTSARPYRKALDTEIAIGEIIKGAGTQFDPDVARVFVEKILCRRWPE